MNVTIRDIKDNLVQGAKEWCGIALVMAIFTALIYAGSHLVHLLPQ